MKRALFLSAAVLLTATQAHATLIRGHAAQIPSGPAPSGSCTEIEDLAGCLDAQSVGEPLITDLHAVAAQNGQSWVSNPLSGINVAGVNYHVGPDPNAAKKHAAIDTASIPAGCQFQPTGSPDDGPYILCDRVSDGHGGFIYPVNVSFDNWAFDDDGLGNGCVKIHFTARSSNGADPAASVRSFTNDEFQFNGACVTNAGSLLDAETGANFTLIVRYSDIDGNWPNSLPTSGHVSAAIAPALGPADIEYNNFHNLPGRPANGAVTNQLLLLAHNVINGFSMDLSGSHGASIENLPTRGSTATNEIYDYNNVIIPATTPVSTTETAITAPFSTLTYHTPTPLAGTSYGTIEVKGNIVTTNLNSANGLNPISVALSWLTSAKSVANYIVQDNRVDPTGAAVCIETEGGAFSASGFVDNNGGGGPGNTLTITALPNGNIFPGATFRILATSGWVDAVVQPYGSTCDGAVSTGGDGNSPATTAGTPVTYCLGGSPQGKFVMNGGSTAGQTENTVVTNFVMSGNTNLRDGSPITASGTQWSSGTCNHVHGT